MSESVRAVEKHPRAARWMHWVNFPLLTVMIWSGLLIYWAYDPYFLGWGDWVLFNFFPDSVYEALDLEFGLARGMAYHYLFAWLFTLNGVAYVLYTAVSGEWRHMVPDRRDWRDAFGVVLHDLRIRRKAPVQGKYNAAQKITYSAVIVMGLGSVLTGLAIYKPTQLAWLTALFGGYQSARTVHFVLTVLYLLFFVVHIAQVVRAGWSNFWSMVMGYERETVEAEPAETEPAAVLVVPGPGEPTPAPHAPESP